MRTIAQQARQWSVFVVSIVAIAACGSESEPEAAAAPSKTTAASATETSGAAQSTSAGSPASAAAQGRAGAGASAFGKPPGGAGASAAAASGGAGSAAPSGHAGAAAADSGGAGAAAPSGGSAAAAAGSGGAASPAHATKPGIPCDVFKALANSCHRCHGPVPANGAPMSLVEPADFQVLTVQTPKIPKYQQARERMDGTKQPRMPPPGSPITDEDKQILIDWLGRGAPAAEGDTASCP